MKKSYRLISLALTALLLCVGCGTTTVEPEDVTDTTDTETTAPEEITDGLPDLNYNDEDVYILNMEYIISGPESIDESLDNMGQADVVQAANYYRHLAVEERLGVDITFIEETKFANIPGLVRQSVNAGSHDYDMVFTVASQQAILIQEGLYVPISELKYVNLDNPWWNKEYIDSVSINYNNPYVLFGDITFNTVQRTCAMYFNTRLLDVYLGMTDNDIYQIVLDGKWTFDKLYELASGVYEDDGDGINNKEDIHGITYFSNGTTANFIAYSAGLEFTDRDDDGYPVINLNNERCIDLAEKMLKLFNGQHVYSTPNNNEHIEHFTTGKALFLANRFYVCDWPAFREMTDNYGIIPMPKYDETIDGYHSAVEELVQWGTVPVTTPDYDMVSAVAESMAFEGYKNVTPAYYETALKLKFTRGEDLDKEAAIIDMITSGARTDFLCMNKLNGLGNIFANICSSGQNNFASLYASLETSANTALKELIEYDKSNG